MTVERIRDLLALAKAIDADLRLHYTGKVFITEEDGDIECFTALQTVGHNWEVFSEDEGRALSEPSFMIDGEEFTERQARVKQQERHDKEV